METKYGVPRHLPNGKNNPEYSRLASDDWRRRHGVPIRVSRYGISTHLPDGRFNPQYGAARRREKGMAIRLAGNNKYGLPARLPSGKTNPEYMRAYAISNPIPIFVAGTLGNHRALGHEVRVSNTYIIKLATRTDVCPIGGELLDYRLGIGLKDLHSAPSLDRINNEGTLNYNNVWIICKFHNAMKSDMPLAKWIDFCEEVSNNSKEILHHYDEQKKFLTKLAIASQYGSLSYSFKRAWARSSLGGHRRRKYKIKITVDMLEALALYVLNCYICGTRLDYRCRDQLAGHRKARENTPSLDMVDGNHELTVNNIAIACQRCNCFKQNLSIDALISECRLITSKRLVLLKSATHQTIETLTSASERVPN